MRFTKISPVTLEDLKTAILDDIDCIGSGLRPMASDLPVPERGAIDLLAADGRGRLALISFCLTADHESVGHALARWDWVLANLGALRVLAPMAGLDLATEPRVILAAGGVTASARRLSGFISRPEIELLEVTLVAAGDRRGVMIERAAARALPAGGMAPGIDPVLAPVPAGETRSLMRRILEEVRGADVDGQALVAVPADGSVDLVLGDRIVASLVAAAGALQLRLVDRARTLPVGDDQECRAAASQVLRAAREGDTATAPATITERLTPEELAEFERIAGPGAGAESRAGRSREHDTRPPGTGGEMPAVTVMRHRFVEN